MRIITSDRIKNKGFLKLLREYNVGLFKGKISLDEFGLMQILIMNADWDNRHRNYGKLCLSNKLLGKIKGLSRNKVAILKASLINKKYIKIIGKENLVDIIEVCNFNKYQPNPDFGYAKIFYDASKEADKPFKPG